MSTTIKSKDGTMECGAIDTSIGELLDIKYDSKSDKFIAKRRNWFQRFFIDGPPETETKYLGISFFEEDKKEFAYYGEFFKNGGKLFKIYADFPYQWSEDSSPDWKTSIERKYFNVEAFLRNKKLIEIGSETI